MNWLLPLVLLVAPIKVETGQFNIVQDGKKVGTEQYSISEDSNRLQDRRPNDTRQHLQQDGSGRKPSSNILRIH